MANGIDEPKWVAFRPNGKHGGSRRSLGAGTKHSGAGVRFETLVQVRHYADDLHGSRAGADQDSLADRVFPIRISRPQTARQAFINDRHRRRARDISRIELAPPPKWNLQRAEICWSDVLYDPERPLVQFQWRLLRELHGSPGEARQGKRQCHRGAADAGHRLYSSDKGLIECRPLLVRVIARWRQRNL